MPLICSTAALYGLFTDTPPRASSGLIHSISFDRSAINETFKKPFDAQLLAERLKTLIGARKELV